MIKILIAISILALASCEVLQNATVGVKGNYGTYSYSKNDGISVIVGK